MATPTKKTTPASKPTRSLSTVNSETVTLWLRAMVDAMPRGGKTIAAQTLGISPPALSKILNRPERAFDEKTIRLLSWVEKSKADKYDKEQFPVKQEYRIGDSMVIEERIQPAGPNFFVWRLP